MNRICLIFLIIIIPCLSSAQGSGDCDEATQLAIQAFDMGHSPDVYPRQKQLLRQAIALCPTHSEAHNNLASVLEMEREMPVSR